MPGTLKDEVICFVHIPKTGGNSFRKSCLLPTYDRTETYRFQSYRQLILDPPGNTTKLIVGHAPYGIHRLMWNRQVRRNVIYITILREPLDRCISNYFFIKQLSSSNQPHPSSTDAERHNIVDFYRLPRHQNRQTKYIAGFPASLLLGALGDNLTGKRLLAIAKQNLAKQFASFGILEHLSEYQSWFADRYGLSNENVVAPWTQTKVRPQTNELSKTEIERLSQYNQLDCELYKYAKRLFLERYAS